MSDLFDVLLIAIALVVLAHAAFLATLVVIALPRPRLSIPPSQPLRMAIVVPAHNEEAIITACLQSLAAVRYEPRPRILVVADNCTDATAAVACDLGAEVLERNVPDLRGKSYALDFAIAHLAAAPPDAVVFVDADTTVSQNLLLALSDRFARGAQAIQVHYAADTGETHLESLRSLAFLLVHWARPLGLSRLHLGSGLKGNGMAFMWPVVSAGVGGSGVTEDAAMTLSLARRGIAVAFEPRATVVGKMASDFATGRVQDERWEGGRFSLALSALDASVRAARRGHLPAAVASLEVMLLPLTILMALSALIVVAAFAGFGSPALAFAGGAGLVFYVIVGLVSARPTLSQVLSLAYAPRFVIYKLSVYGALLARRGPTAWERTTRG
jgi:1,2-diacylglycerol 3-beta-glucosyltransferase